MDAVAIRGIGISNLYLSLPARRELRSLMHSSGYGGIAKVKISKIGPPKKK
jgi:hypothetical protein